jgi:LemA protein
MLPLIILGGIVLVILLWAVATYNGLINKKNKVEYAFSSIDVMLKKRRDLIPNLVSSVKQYMTHERELLERITEARAGLMKDGISDKERFNMENQISSMLGQIKVAVENYPDLKANQNVMQLQASLNEVEEQISAARRAYNASVLDINNGIEMFPSSIIAGMMKMERRESFEIPPEERENVDVGNLFNS